MIDLEWLDDAICNALMAAKFGRYDGVTVEMHLEYILEKVREAQQ